MTTEESKISARVTFLESRRFAANELEMASHRGGSACSLECADGGRN